MAQVQDQRFEIIRKRIAGQTASDEQRARDELKRSAARGGMINSGAYNKQQQQIADSAAANRAQAMEGVDMAELAEKQRRDEIREGREFQRAERLGSQEFAKGERLGGQEFAKGERLGGQEFAALQAALQRSFQTSERLGGQKFAAMESGRQRSYSRSLFNKEMAYKKAAMDLQNTQWEKQFEEDKRISDFNMKMAEKMSNKRGLMDRMIDPMGWFGQNDKGGTTINPKAGLGIDVFNGLF